MVLLSIEFEGGKEKIFSSFSSSSSSRWNNYCLRNFYPWHSTYSFQAMNFRYRSLFRRNSILNNSSRWWRQKPNISEITTIVGGMLEKITYTRANEFYIVSFHFFFFAKIYHINRYLKKKVKQIRGGIENIPRNKFFFFYTLSLVLFDYRNIYLFFLSKE